jgi:hypothetical protein
MAGNAAAAQPEFNEWFCDSTLRVDYIFGGGPDGVMLCLDGMTKTPGWAGRRHNLDEVPLAGFGSVEVVDPTTKRVLYKNTFSSLFQEWLGTEEAATDQMAFENSFLVPLPKGEADIVLTLTDARQERIAKATHRYRPTDELVKTGDADGRDVVYIHRGGDPSSAIDIAMIPEGYRAAERETFLEDARRMTDEILRYEPFASNRDKFNFVAVMVPSEESGVSIPLEGVWLDTAYKSHFSTFHSARYLTAPAVKRMHETLEGVPYEHVVILANTDRYGGGGIYNSYLMSAVHNEKALPVTVHEFGHSFGGLADEYFYESEDNGFYPLDVEPWEPNITTKVDFKSKWEDMVDGKSEVGLYEGGGCMVKGVYRPVPTCRMRDNDHPVFCPVCERALSRVIEFYTR